MGASFSTQLFSRKLKTLETQAVEDVKAVMAEKTRSLVVAEFQASLAPSGEPWKPSKDRQRVLKVAGQILRDTGRLLNSIRATVTPQGFKISTNVVYAPLHNFGSSKMPQRNFLPDYVPPAWERAFKKILSDAFKKAAG